MGKCFEYLKKNKKRNIRFIPAIISPNICVNDSIHIHVYIYVSNHCTHLSSAVQSNKLAVEQKRVIAIQSGGTEDNAVSRIAVFFTVRCDDYVGHGQLTRQHVAVCKERGARRMQVVIFYFIILERLVYRLNVVAHDIDCTPYFIDRM